MIQNFCSKKEVKFCCKNFYMYTAKNVYGFKEIMQLSLLMTSVNRNSRNLMCRWKYRRINSYASQRSRHQIPFNPDFTEVYFFTVSLENTIVHNFFREKGIENIATWFTGINILANYRETDKTQKECSGISLTDKEDPFRAEEWFPRNGEYCTSAVQDSPMGFHRNWLSRT